MAHAAVEGCDWLRHLVCACCLPGWRESVVSYPFLVRRLWLCVHTCSPWWVASASAVVVVWLRVIVVRFDHGERHDVVAAAWASADDSEALEPAAGHNLRVLAVQRVMRSRILKLLMRWQTHRVLAFLLVAFSPTLLLRLQSLFVSASARGLSSLTLCILILLHFFVLSVVYVFRGV